jgi:hypothetical protein
MISSFSSLGMIQRKAAGGGSEIPPGIGVGTWVNVGTTSDYMTGKIATSFNGNTWTILSQNSIGGLNGSINGVKYANNRWIAVGQGSTIATSINGTSWNAVYFMDTGGILDGQAVSYGNNTWVVVGSKIVKSIDNGNTWIAANTNGNVTNFSCVEYGNNIWVAGGGSGSIMATSTDNGDNWNAIPTNLRGGITSPIYIVYENGIWIACGSSGTKLAYSQTGTSWTSAPSSAGLNVVNCAAYGNGLWVAVGTGSAIATSPDGINWTQVNSLDRGGITSGRGVAYGNGLWIIVGNNFNIIYSITGKKWWPANSAFYANFNGNRVAFSP